MRAPGEHPGLLSTPKGPRTLTFRLSNGSPWLDLCALLRVQPGGAADMRRTLGGKDAMAEVGRKKSRVSARGGYGRGQRGNSRSR